MRDSNPLSKVLKFWPLLMFLGAGVGAFTKLFYQVADHEKRIMKVEESKEKWLERALQRHR